MEPYDNSIPSHSWDDPLWNNDNIEETLESMDLFSEQHAREDSTFPIHSPPHLTTDSELLGILSGNAIDDMETDTDDDSDDDTDDEDNQQLPVMQDNVMPDEEWLSGNPRDSIELPFLKSTGLKEPINFFDALCTTELLDLFKDCSNEYGEKEKRTSVSAQSRSNHDKKSIFTNIKNVMCEHGTSDVQLFKNKKNIDYFNARMLEIYYPTKDIKIDESMMLWRGRLRFRQYMKGKRHKYGLKFYALSDQLGVVMKLHLYGGATDTLVGGKKHVNKVVEYLLQDLKNLGHHLFVDNYYTSVDLVKKLRRGEAAATKVDCTKFFKISLIKIV
ncbi:hypothetical protein ABMA28_003163 [Loxostege sticticalis]|uniref:PiggyBac transposable element-derived protein domain-containing protein n=1 Tax=Loxostege sticticalis TaxID=481309 RepID=A0ABD0SV79_LOXSC